MGKADRIGPYWDKMAFLDFWIVMSWWYERAHLLKIWKMNEHAYKINYGDGHASLCPSYS